MLDDFDVTVCTGQIQRILGVKFLIYVSLVRQFLDFLNIIGSDMIDQREDLDYFFSGIELISIPESRL